MFTTLFVFAAISSVTSLPQSANGRDSGKPLELGQSCPISERLLQGDLKCDDGLKCVPNPNNVDNKVGICVKDDGSSPNATENVSEEDVLEGGGYSPEVIEAVSSDPFAWMSERGLDNEPISEGERAFGELLQNTGNTVLSSFLGGGLFELVKNTEAVAAVKGAFSSLVSKFFGNGPPSRLSLAARSFLSFFITISSSKGWKAMNIAAGALNTNALPLLAPVSLQIAMITCGAKSSGDIIGQMFKGSDFNSLDMTTEQAANAIAVAVQGHADNSNLKDFSLDATLGTLATCMFNRNTQRMIMVAKLIKDENLVSNFVPGLGDDSAFKSTGTSTFPEDASVTESPLSPVPNDSIEKNVLQYCFGKELGPSDKPNFDNSKGDKDIKYCPNYDPLEPFPDNQVQNECDICCRTAQGADENFSDSIGNRLEDRCKENIRSDPNGPNPGFRCKC